MLNVILLVHSAHDLAGLSGASKSLKRFGCNACWVIYSPAVLADAESVNAEFDKQISSLNEAIRRASATEDFDGAKGYKEQRDALVMQKGASVKEAYKSLTPEQQQAAAQKLFGPFYESQPAPSVKISRHGDHYETSNWIEMVNSLRGAWPSNLPAGDYMVTWPGQMALLGGESSPMVTASAVAVSPAQSAPAVSTSDAAAKPKVPSKSYTSTKRFKILCSMGIDALGQEAMRAGIAQPVGSKLSIAHQTIKAEIAKAGGVLPE